MVKCQAQTGPGIHHKIRIIALLLYIWMAKGLYTGIYVIRNRHLNGICNWLIKGLGQRSRSHNNRKSCKTKSDSAMCLFILAIFYHDYTFNFKKPGKRPYQLTSLPDNLDTCRIKSEFVGTWA